jgi:hypothetical protein
VFGLKVASIVPFSLCGIPIFEGGLIKSLALAEMARRTSIPGLTNTWRLIPKANVLVWGWWWFWW